MNGVRASGGTGGQIQVAIVADDLTGAADCAAAFAATGHRPTVLLEPGGCRRRWTAGGGIVALSANSRDVEAAAARDATANAVRELSAGQPHIWFKKIDSTLRGHLGTELSVIGELLHPEVTIVCPAFPRTGRILREGRVYVRDQPLEHTPLWQAAGGGPAHLPSMLSGSVGPVVSVALTELRSGSLASSLATAVHGTTMIVDAEDDDDLGTMMQAGLASGRSLLWVGSAGLAAALASALQGSTVDAAAGAPAFPEPPGPLAVEGPVLIVAGSGAVQTRRQLADLVGSCEAEVATVPVEALLERKPTVQRDMVALLARTLTAARDAVVAIEPVGAGRYRGDVDLCDRLGALVGGAAGGFAGLVLTGGDTARAVLQAMGIAELSVLGSLEDGVPLSRASATGQLIVTKAGAFGDDRSLTRAVQLLHRAEAEIPT